MKNIRTINGNGPARVTMYQQHGNQYPDNPTWEEQWENDWSELKDIMMTSTTLDNLPAKQWRRLREIVQAWDIYDI